MSQQDFYKLLGVPKNASSGDIKKAYHRLAKECHPDRNPGNKAMEAKFKEISYAYEVLSNPSKRKTYDNFGQSGLDNASGGQGGRGGSQGFHSSGFGFSSGGFDVFEDMIDELMGGRRSKSQGSSQAGRGSDLRFDMELTLFEAFKGVQTKITIPNLVACGECRGTGGEKGAAPVTCKTCRGHGQVRTQQGFFTVERTCPSCQGLGRKIEKPCSGCHGAGRVRREKTLAVTIPGGVDNGSRVRLPGEGEAGVRGGASGDLYICITLRPHDLFQREGSHIHCKVPLPFATAALGGSLEVPTIDGGRVRLTVPPGTQSGHQFRIKGKGMALLQSSLRGDMYVHVATETPVSLNKQQESLLRQFVAEENYTKSQPSFEGFFKKARDFWDSLKQ